MSKIADKLKRAISFPSTRSSSSRASIDMEVDPPSAAVGAPFQSAPMERNVLLQEKQLKLQDDREKNINKKLKDRDFILTPTFDPALLQSTGMDSEFELIFKVVGWEIAREIDESGCKL